MKTMQTKTSPIPKNLRNLEEVGAKHITQAPSLWEQFANMLVWASILKKKEERTLAVNQFRMFADWTPERTASVLKGRADGDMPWTYLLFIQGLLWSINRMQDGPAKKAAERMRREGIACLIRSTGYSEEKILRLLTSHAEEYDPKPRI